MSQRFQDKVVTSKGPSAANDDAKAFDVEMLVSFGMN